MEDNRLVFDKITNIFDKWRCRYSQELFNYIIQTCSLDNTKKCLEIGPGTGQATDFALQAGCDYTAIELGENLTAYMKEKYAKYPNFNIVNADFETYPFRNGYYDLVYSASTIQWIREDIAYSKCVDILKDGGYLAMFVTRGDYQRSNPELYSDIQKIYDMYFKPQNPYRCKFNYEIGSEYGLKYLGRKEFYGKREFTADEYIEYIHTHSDHTAIKEDCREPFFEGIRQAILNHGNHIVFYDTYVLYLYQKFIEWNIDLIKGIKQEEIDFPKRFASYEEKEYGILFYMADNKDSYDGNHACIYPDRITDLGAVLDDITEFYSRLGTNASIYHPFEKDYFKNNLETLKAHGYTYTSEDDHRVMLLTAENSIVAPKRLDICVLNEWDERVATDILIPSGEPWEIEVTKKRTEQDGTYLFVGYLDGKAVVYSDIHKSEHGNTRFDYIVTAKEHRGNGYASELLSFMVEYCKENNFPMCWQWAGPSEHICYKAGFREAFTMEAGFASKA